MTSIRPCWADGYLSDRSWKIARHEKRTTSITFEDSASSPGAHWGLLFFTDAASETTPEGDEIIRYASLPHCKKPVVRLEEVFQTSPGSDALDVLYYSPSDTEQQNQKSHYPGFTVPYNPLLTRSSKTNRTDFWQLFARFAQIPCLPTRFHFTYIGSKRYISYRSGSAAWQ